MSQANQSDIVRHRAIEMIEYALFCVPSAVLQDESEGCVRAIIELQTAVQDFPAIDVTIMRHILCNLRYGPEPPFTTRAA